MLQFRSTFTLFVVLLTATFLQALTPQVRDTARADISAGKADEAAALLQAGLAENNNDAEAHLLLCRVYYSEERWDDAVRECAQAVAINGSSSNNHLWLGRAEGEKADRVSFVHAYGLGKKTRVEFESAVQLDGGNVEALADLGEFYFSAPAIIGGGVKKALAVADMLDQYNRAQAEQLRGRIAISQKDLSGAEEHYKNAISLAPESAEYWMVLASFYRRQGDLAKMETALRSGIAADKTRGPALVSAAHILTRAQQDPQLAIELLRTYLASPGKSPDEPAFRVHALLGNLLEARGDTKEAQAEFAAAAALASSYHPVKAATTNTGR